jgi:hypothetical protein
MGNLPQRANLSAADVLSLQPDVERVIVMGTNPATRWSAKCVKRFVAVVVPMFKAAMIASNVDEQGRPIVRIHYEQWEVMASKSIHYAKLRDAFGWFVSTSDKPLAAMWAFLPPLTRDAPRRELGHRWEIAVVAARKAQRRTGQMDVLHG